MDETTKRRIYFLEQKARSNWTEWVVAIGEYGEQSMPAYYARQRFADALDRLQSAESAIIIAV